MKRLKEIAKRLWQDESAQGTSEYILLLVAIIAVAMLFKERIYAIIKEKMIDVEKSVGDFKSSG